MNMYTQVLSEIEKVLAELPGTFTAPGNRIAWLRLTHRGDAEDMAALPDNLMKLGEDIAAGRIVAGRAVGRSILSEELLAMTDDVCRGWRIEHDMSPYDLGRPGYGDVICEVKEGEVGRLASTYRVIGEVLEEPVLLHGHIQIMSLQKEEEEMPADVPAVRRAWGWGRKAVGGYGRGRR
ncbi:MAG: hypothetical protein Q4G47_00140 [Lachnospiraceae bacterium]|nr:hypothetical protein [Lachnospiraceae bacterium]